MFLMNGARDERTSSHFTLLISSTGRERCAFGVQAPTSGRHSHEGRTLYRLPGLGRETTTAASLFLSDIEYCFFWYELRYWYETSAPDGWERQGKRTAGIEGEARGTRDIWPVAMDGWTDGTHAATGHMHDLFTDLSF